MNDINRKAKLCARIGLILTIICFVLAMLVRICPAPFMAIFGMKDFNHSLLLNPLTYITEIVSFGVYLLLYFLLKSDMNGKSHVAGALLILVLAFIGVQPIFSLLHSHITMFGINTLTGVNEVASYSVLQTVIGYIGIIGTLSRPLLAVAAALNWADSKTRQL